MRRRHVRHFVLIGAALFAVSRSAGEPSALGAAAPIAPGQAVGDEELLCRAALARGLDRADPVVQARLIQNMRFLGADGGGGEMYREARALGLGDADVVVRRRLADRMRRLLETPALDSEPSDAELQAYLERHPSRFAPPARRRLTHVFLSRQRRGAALLADAERLLRRLTPADVARAAELGDALPVPAVIDAASEHDLARLLGRDFAAAAMAQEPGRWQGPLASPYGLHLVWLGDGDAGELPPLDAVRGAVRAAVREERAAAALRDGLARLRAGEEG